jgi:hypothetical protein
MVSSAFSGSRVASGFAASGRALLTASARAALAVDSGALSADTVRTTGRAGDSVLSVSTAAGAGFDAAALRVRITRFLEVAGVDWSLMVVFRWRDYTIGNHDDLPKRYHECRSCTGRADRGFLAFQSAWNTPRSTLRSQPVVCS